MAKRQTGKERKAIRAERADTVCGEIPHMTVDQVAARLSLEGKELRCPACGRVHLTEDDLKKAKARRFSDTQRFQEIKRQAEGGKEGA